MRVKGGKVPRFQRTQTTYSIGLQWRQEYRGLSSEIIDGVLVVHAPDKRRYEIAQYVILTDALTAVIRSGVASAAFSGGEFRGWHATPEIAIASLRGR